MIPLVVATCLLWGPPGPQSPGYASRDTVTLAPSFSVTDLQGAPVTSARFKGKTTVLFVFCECRECRLVAEEWARRRPVGPGLQAFVCYSGNAQEVQKMAKAWPGSPEFTRFLVDPKFTIAERYRALPCPAAYVVDGLGRLRYSSKEGVGELGSDPKIIVGQVLGSVADVRSGRPVVLASRMPIASATLVPVATIANIRQDERTIAHVISAAKSDKEATVERTFQFRNPGKASVRIDQVVSSCGCSDAGILTGGALASSGAVAPGQAVTVRVRLKVAPNYTGQRAVQVWLLGKGSPLPIGCVQIEVRGSS